MERRSGGPLEQGPGGSVHLGTAGVELGPAGPEGWGAWWSGDPVGPCRAVSQWTRVARALRSRSATLQAYGGVLAVLLVNCGMEKPSMN
jgi:hypothetical protein